jgi:hypothetical protein
MMTSQGIYLYRPLFGLCFYLSVFRSNRRYSKVEELDYFSPLLFLLFQLICFHLEQTYSFCPPLFQQALLRAELEIMYRIIPDSTNKNHHSSRELRWFGQYRSGYYNTRSRSRGLNHKKKYEAVCAVYMSIENIII